MTLTHVASRFVNCPLMIHPPKLEVIIKALGPRLGIDPDAVLARRVPMDATATLMARYSDAGDERDYAVLDGVAVVPVQGTLLKKESFLSAWSGASSYEQIQRQVARAVDDASVRAILLDIDSPGGETTGCFELADYIYSIRGVKPVYAAANDIALSAAYAIASSASKVFVTRTGAVGSIGVYALHVDQSEFDKEIGAKYTFIFAGDKKVDGNPHEPLGESARGDIQAEVDREYAIFVETVARNRKASTKAIVGTQAGLLWAENALPLLADQVGTLEDALTQLQTQTGSRTRAAISTRGEHMTEDPQALAAKRECDEKADDKKSKKDDAKEREGKKPPADDDEDDDKEEAKSKKAAATVLPISGEPLKGMRAETDIQAIAALCKMAGCPEKAAEFLMLKNPRGEYMSVAEVSEALTSSRVAESEKRMISSHVNPNAGSGGVQELEAQAVSLARQNRGQVTNGLYVSGTATRVTKERAYAQMLEEHPEAYAAFRAQHNAKGLIATLEAAGVRLAR
ncbi:MAG TPA: S49 family peptidase [Gemmataceae bacterium]|nr:S49 family peptidase [Bryobacteraceae bacterium]HZV04745.1 S49 family peptidase [Gemmataceae bacterium]